MVAIKVAINGFGRIGRLVLRAGINNRNIEFVGINDLVPPENLAYLFKYDSTHGRFDGTVEADADSIIVNGTRIPCFSCRNPADLPWAEHQVDYVVEATGLFRTHDTASAHLQAGAKRVILSAPTKDPERVKTLLVGVNHTTFDPAVDTIVSNASCTTNCLAPVAKVIHDNFGLSEGLMTTIHATTATQPTVDGPSKKDFRGGRGASQNIIPASTGAAKAVGLVLPELKGKLTGMAMRVPTPNVSVVDLTFRTERSTSYALTFVSRCGMRLWDHSQGCWDIPMNLSYPVTLLMILAPVFLTLQQGWNSIQTSLKIVSWYDNEWGYSNRVVDLMLFMAVKEGILTAASFEQLDRRLSATV